MTADGLEQPDEPGASRPDEGDRSAVGRDGILGLLLGQLPIVLWTTDLDLRFTLSSGAGLQALQLEENRVVGVSLQDYLGSEDPDNVAIAAHRAALEGRTTIYEIEFQGATWSCHTGPLRDQGGELIGTVGIGRDITQRRLAEEALRESESKYRRLFEESRDVIFISTPEGRLIDINPAGVGLFGFESREQMLATDLSELYWSPVERARYLQLIGDGDFVRELELQLKARDGRRIVALETSQVVRDEDGRVMFYRGSLRDVTDRRDLEAQLRQALRMEAVGRMAGAVAHDFNNVLTVVQGRADLLLAKMEGSHPLRPDVQAIREAGDRATALTRQLLALRRHRDREPKRLAVREFLESIEVRLRRVIQPGVELELEVDPDTWPMRADPNQIEQVLTRLAVNSREAMPHGGKLVIAAGNLALDDRTERRRVELEEREYVVLTIRDDGVGMTAEVREHAFDPFFSTRRAGSSAGLGLTTVYAVVSQHQGHIRVESQPGEGATFFIYLPRYGEMGE